MKKTMFIIIAVDQKNGIGKNGVMPWHFKKELNHFAKITKTTDFPEKENMVIMGRKTWESLPETFRPLPGRKNVILTKNKDLKIKGAEVFNSMEEAIESADEKTEKIFIIGGGEVFRQGLELEDLDGIYLTRVNKTYDCDTFFPEVPSRFQNKEKLGEDEEKGVSFEYFKIT
jgi:dihydrofolate reductase